MRGNGNGNGHSDDGEGPFGQFGRLLLRTAETSSEALEMIVGCAKFSHEIALAIRDLHIRVAALEDAQTSSPKGDTVPTEAEDEPH